MLTCCADIGVDTCGEMSNVGNFNTFEVSSWKCVADVGVETVGE